MEDQRWLVEALRGCVHMPVPADALHLAGEHRVDGLIGSAVMASAVPLELLGVDADDLFICRGGGRRQ